MYHDLPLLLLMYRLILMPISLCRSLIALAHLHIFIAITLGLLDFVFFVLASAALGFEIFTAGIGFFIFVFPIDSGSWTGCVFRTVHLLVFAFDFG